jgi:RNA polymerase sigma-70 factor (sigma-E family)
VAVAVDDLEFREFFSSQYGRLCWLGFLLTGDRIQAEELAQDTLVRVWGRWADVGRPADPAQYARKVLINRHRSLMRRALVELRHRATLTQESYVPSFGEDAMVVWAAVRRLPTRQRLVLALRYHEDLSELEVARLLRLPVGTVKTLARRGLAGLRRQLGTAAPVNDLKEAR